ncbi:MAG: Na(+)/H(+) antiporter subunit B [Pleomorphochaeta sp.]
MNILLLSLILCLSIFSLISKDLLHSIIALSAISILSALFFTFLKAPDVAITEAAVGTGVSTIIYVWAIRHTKRKDGDK